MSELHNNLVYQTQTQPISQSQVTKNCYDGFEIVNSNTYQQENENLFPVGDAGYHKTYEHSYIPETVEQGILDSSAVVNSGFYPNVYQNPYQQYQPSYQLPFQQFNNPSQQYQLQQKIQLQVQQQVQQQLHQQAQQLQHLQHLQHLQNQAMSYSPPSSQYIQHQPRDQAAFIYEPEQLESNFAFAPATKTLSPILNPATLVLNNSLLKQDQPGLKEKEEKPLPHLLELCFEKSEEDDYIETKEVHQDSFNNNSQNEEKDSKSDIKEENVSSITTYKDLESSFFDDEDDSDDDKNSDDDLEKDKSLTTLSTLEPRKRGRRQKKEKKGNEELLLPPPSPRTIADPELLQQYRQERNRLAAKRSRERKKEYIHELEKTCKELRSLNDELSKEMAKLKKEMEKLKGKPVKRLNSVSKK